LGKSCELFEGIDFRADWPDHGAILLHHKLDAVAGFQPEASTYRLREGDLALAADCAGIFQVVGYFGNNAKPAMPREKANHEKQ